MLDNMLFDLPSFINLVLSGLIGVVTSWAITYVYYKKIALQNEYSERYEKNSQTTFCPL